MMPRLSADLRRAVTGFFWKALSSPFEKACRVVLVFVAAPALGAAAFGTYQFAVTVTTMLASATELGLGTWTTRAIARDPNDAGASMLTGLWLRSLAVAPYAIALAILTLTEGHGAPQQAMLLFGAAALAGSGIDFFGAVFRGREDFRHEAMMNALRAVATTALALAGLHATHSLLGFAIGFAAGAVASGAAGLWLLRERYAPVMAAADRARATGKDVARAVLAETVPLWLSGLLAMLYFRSDVLAVRYFSGEAEVGAYAASYRIFEATMILPGAVMAVAFPRLARARGQRDAADGARLERRIVWLLLALSAPIAAGLWLADDRLVAALLGSTFGRSVVSLRVLACAVPITFASYALSTFVITRGRERAFVKVLGAMLALNVALNLALVPRLGGPGAAWSTLVTELALVVACVAVLRSR